MSIFIDQWKVLYGVDLHLDHCVWYPAINVKVYTSLYNSKLSHDDNEIAYTLFQEYWWDWARELAKSEYGYSNVFSQGRSSGWLVVEYNNRLVTLGWLEPETDDEDVVNSDRLQNFLNFQGVIQGSLKGIKERFIEFSDEWKASCEITDKEIRSDGGSISIQSCHHDSYQLSCFSCITSEEGVKTEILEIDATGKVLEFASVFKDGSQNCFVWKEGEYRLVEPAYTALTE